MPEIGNTLREARIRRGLTIKDVEAVTKIRAKYLEALEEDDFEVLPGPTYVKAFLRTYASFLRLDPDELLDQLQPGGERRRDDSASVRGDSARRPGSRRAAEWERRRKRRDERARTILGILVVVAVVLVVWSVWGSGSTETATTSAVGDSGPGTSAAGTGATTQSGTLPAAPSSAPPSSAIAGAPTGDAVQLDLTVTEGSCWLVVKENDENGAELFAGTLSAGGHQSFNSAKRYWLNVGKPDVLGVEINGSPQTLDAGSGSFIFIVTEAGIEPSG